MSNFTVFAAFTIGGCLAAFSAINLYNILKFHKDTKATYREGERLSEVTVLLAGLGTILFFVESFLYIILVFLGELEVFNAYLPTPSFLRIVYVQGAGLGFMVFGYFLFTWSVVARGKYATSWKMRENHKLVTWGPYRYVRHPSYTAYFLMFLGFALTWLNPAAFLPLMAIPGYVKLTAVEEELLVKRFGEEYKLYQRRTGRFFPKRLSRNS